MSKLVSIVITLIVIGLLLGIGFLVLGEFRNNIDNEVASVTDEAITLSDTGAYLAYNYSTAGVDCYNHVSISALWNETSGASLASSNYTVGVNTGLVTPTGTSSYNNTEVIANYSYYYGKDACGSIQDVESATQKIPTWLGIVIILLIVGILLTIVFKVLPRGEAGMEGGSSGYGSVTAEI